MKPLIAAIVATALIAGAAGSATAQGYGRQDHGQQDAQHPGWGQDYGSGGHNWNRGERMGYNDWSSAAPVNYRQHHLRRPARGYEWRESNGQYVLAAIATGLIASTIIHGNR
jgi:Ni/Co efflux regulator RcnB